MADHPLLRPRHVRVTINGRDGWFWGWTVRNGEMLAVIEQEPWGSEGRWGSEIILLQPDYFVFKESWRIEQHQYAETGR